MARARTATVSYAPYLGVDANERLYRNAKNYVVDILLSGVRGVNEGPQPRRAVLTEDAIRLFEKAQTNYYKLASQKVPGQGRYVRMHEYWVRDLGRLLTEVQEVMEGVRPPKMTEEDYIKYYRSLRFSDLEIARLMERDRSY